MKPLQSVAMGLVIVVVTARLGGYDLLPDPLGWLLVLIGLRGLPDAYRQRSTTIWLGVVVLAVSVVLWFPATETWLDDHDASLHWAVNLPQALVLAWFAHTLAGHAAAADQRATRWLRTTATLITATAIAPVLVFGAGIGVLETPSHVLAALALLMLIVLLFGYAGRPWASRDGDGRGRALRADPSNAERPAPPEGGRAVRRVELGQAGMTLRATVADTSSCSLTDTSWVPSDLIGLPTTIVRLSTASPDVSVERARRSRQTVTAPNRRPPRTGADLDVDRAGLELGLDLRGVVGSRTAREERAALIDSIGLLATTGPADARRRAGGGSCGRSRP